ncbi:uncharacterized protein LOC143292749 [Babylonia areolata]|uniref:uncharacterized protein LOC143292749 n=1 Tax=Babylonia areolata TaxID=304850 RepID=UPI003FD49727
MTTSKAAVSSTVLALLAITVLLGLLGNAQCQNYHYSNGWHPGKRGDGAELLRQAVLSHGSLPIDNQHRCTVRRHMLHIISELITDEIALLEKSCSSDDHGNFFNMLLQRSPAAPDGIWLQLKGEEEGRQERATQW